MQFDMRPIQQYVIEAFESVGVQVRAFLNLVLDAGLIHRPG